MNVFQKYQLKQVINADGKMTILGVSKVSDKTAMALKDGAQHFFEMAELSKQTGNYLANLVHSEAALVVNSASAGIAQVIAGIIGRGSLYHVYHPYTDKIKQREIILPMGHDVDYGAPVDVMLRMAGANPILAGYANGCNAEQLELEITEQTAAILYIKSHHTVQKSMLSIAEALEVAHRNQLPLVLDAAAEEDLFSYIALGVDAVIYSGAKAIEGPTSGVVFGKKKYVDWAYLQSKGIGRAMKVGKENILGLTSAIEDYLTIGSESGNSMKNRLKPLINSLSKLEGLDVTIAQDSAGRDIYRANIKVTDKCRYNAFEICELLRGGKLAIYAREYRVNEGIIELDIRAVTDDEIEQIITRFNEILKGKQGER